MAVNQIKDEENKALPGTTAPSNVPSVGSPMPTAPSQQRQGSGSFTNIQSYLNANKNAGQKLASGIGTQVKKEIDPAKQQAQDYNAQVRQGVEAAQGTLNQGQQQLGQLSQIGKNIQGNMGGQFYGQDNDLGISQFKNDPNFNKFQQIQSGAGVNENVLGMQQQAFQNQTNQLNKIAQDKANMAGSESGRFDLLKRTFGGNVNPMYNQGQQRLDQVFLQRQGANQLKENLGQNVAAAKDMLGQVGQTNQLVRTTADTEKALIGNINKQAMSNEADYLKMLESYIPEINKRREQEYTDFDQRLKNTSGSNRAGGLQDVVRVDGPTFQKATPGQPITSGGLSKEDLEMFGIKGPTRTFNVFDTLKSDDIVTRGREAKTFQDAANQNNLNAYNMLSDIARIDSGSRKLTATSDLDKAIQARTGAASLSERLKEAQNTFNTLSAGTNYGEHVKSGKGGWAESQANLADLLSGGSIVSADKRTGYMTNPQTQSIMRRALEDLQKFGYGNVLGEDGMINRFNPNASQLTSEMKTRNQVYGGPVNILGRELTNQQPKNDPLANNSYAARQLGNFGDAKLTSTNIDEMFKEYFKSQGFNE